MEASHTIQSTKMTTGKRSKLFETTQTEEGYVSSFDGTKIWYKSQGKGPAMIFCNGLGCSIFYWKHIHPYFRKKYRVILFDWRGHGHSEKPKKDENININSLSEDLNAIYKKLRIKSAILFGHSMGTQILYDFYKKHPKKVRALIPCSGTFGQPMDTFYNSPVSKYVFAALYLFNNTFPEIASKIRLIFKNNPLWFQMASLLKMMNPGLADRKVLRQYLDHLSTVDPVLFAKLIKSMQETSAEKSLKRIRVPTLIIGGDKDQFTPVWLSKKTHCLIPNSEILIIKKASHVALIEQPALINLRVEKFIQERL